MGKPKILIVGGGIGGLSCATALAETGKFDIHLYESDIIGGQASSKKSKLCNTEISWRIFCAGYNNLFKIMIDNKTINNLYEANGKDGHVCTDFGYFNPGSNINLISSILNNCNYEQINKILTLFFLSKERAITSYHNVKASEYFDSNVMNLVLGPYLGLETKKITLSAYYKYIFGLYNKSLYTDKISVTKYPTNDSLFIPWKNDLLKKGVKIYEHHEMNDIKTDTNGKINGVIINNRQYNADEIIFACSLKPLINIFNNNFNLKKTLINEKLNVLKNGQQFYITVNFYWKVPIIKSKTCHIFTFQDGWMPIIIKRFIETDYVENNCNKNIKEVWNIGVVDYVFGNYVKKYSSKCSYDEIVYEIKMNLINSSHFNNIGITKNSWNDLFYDYEFDDRYQKKLPASEKFSINKGIEENLLNNYEPELGKNIYFSAYYVKNSAGGASMETSCEVGLTTADLICKKYNYDNPREPKLKTNYYIFAILLPFVLLDFILYKLQLRPITDFIYPLLLLLIYVVVILISLYKLITFTYKTLNTKSKFFSKLYKYLF